ncbi:MAG TPA: DUF4402 domain-containing protein [Sphingomicrobium sp.]|jgi:hypothetical protein
MTARTALLAIAIATAALMSTSQSARAQCRLCENPTTTTQAEGADGPIDLQIEAGLDFDRLVVMGSGDGTVTLRPDGTRQSSGSVEAISGRAMVGEARVRGEPGRQVRVEFPSRIELHSLEGATISIDEIVTDLPTAPRLDSAGNLSFRFGGRIHLSGNTDGDFRGDLPIIVEYL